jgi:putative ABC transport system permease protein
VIRLKPGVDVMATKAALREILPQDVLLFTKQEFIDFEQYYWQTSTAIGFIFAMGTGIGFIVGVLIVYQILYTDISDHLPEYATLKAIGYRNFYFVGVIFQQALILAVLAYIPGTLITMLLYSLAAGATNLPITMTVSRAITVLILTILMCCISGMIAMRRLNSADPADIF